MVLPLPLVPFEQYMLLDDRPAYPMSFFARLRFSGRIEHAAVAAAVRRALARHPLLSAVVQPTGRGRYRWVPVEPPEPPLRWVSMPSDDRFPHAEPIDLGREPGFRLTMVEGPGAFDVVFQAHHACCDGLGALRFLEDAMVGYAIETGTAPRRARLRPLREEALRDRGRFGLSAWKLASILPQQAVGLIGAWQFLARSPVPLVPHEVQPAETPPPERFPATVTRCLSQSESAAFVAAAGRRGVTTNDLLARDLLVALREFRRRHGQEHSRDWLRLSIPVSLRGLAERRLPAANVVSMIFLDRRPGDFADPRQLLLGIHEQTEQIKRLGLGLTFVLALRVARALPGGLRRMTSAQNCSATAVFTNLGEPLRLYPLARREGRLVLGDAVLEGIECLAPLRPHTCASLAAVVYAGQLRITLHYDPRPLGPQQAEELLDGFMQRLRDSIGG